MSPIRSSAGARPLMLLLTLAGFFSSGRVSAEDAEHLEKWASGRGTFRLEADTSSLTWGKDAAGWTRHRYETGFLEAGLRASAEQPDLLVRLTFTEGETKHRYEIKGNQGIPGVTFPGMVMRARLEVSVGTTRLVSRDIEGANPPELDEKFFAGQWDTLPKARQALQRDAARRFQQLGTSLSPVIASLDALSGSRVRSEEVLRRLLKCRSVELHDMEALGLPFWRLTEVPNIACATTTGAGLYDFARRKGVVFDLPPETRVSDMVFVAEGTHVGFWVDRLDYSSSTLRIHDVASGRLLASSEQKAWPRGRVFLPEPGVVYGLARKNWVDLLRLTAKDGMVSSVRLPDEFGRSDFDEVLNVLPGGHLLLRIAGQSGAVGRWNPDAAKWIWKSEEMPQSDWLASRCEGGTLTTVTAGVLRIRSLESGLVTAEKPDEVFRYRDRPGWIHLGERPFVVLDASRLRECFQAEERELPFRGYAFRSPAPGKVELLTSWNARIVWDFTDLPVRK
ncbi:MAG: hypothetical protein IT452_02005 [Planctomycetia bacterium]|nr:hypothetical protein [Planctomycetia bacterium]